MYPHLTTYLPPYTYLCLRIHLYFPFINETGHTFPREWTSFHGLLDVGILVSSEWGTDHHYGTQYHHVGWDVFVHPLVNVLQFVSQVYSTLHAAHYPPYRVDVGGEEDLYGGGCHRPPIRHEAYLIFHSDNYPKSI